jgi:hypothetical protein
MKTKNFIKKWCNVLLILLMVLVTFRAFAQNQMKTWYMDNSTIDFSTGTPVLSANGTANTSPMMTNGAYGISNNKLFTVKDFNVYDLNDNLMFQIPTQYNDGIHSFDHVGFHPELIITQVPDECSSYYIIYNWVGNLSNNTSLTTYSMLMYSKIDMNGNNGLGALSGSANEIIEPNSSMAYGQAFRSLALGKLIGNDHRFLYAVYDNVLQKFEVNSTGITLQNSWSNLYTLPFRLHTMELDISPDQSMLAFSNYRYYTDPAPDVVILHLDGNGDLNTSLSNNGVTTIQINNTHHFTGVEFSPDNSKLFFGELELGIKWITNLNTTPIVSSLIINNTTDYSNSQLETAYGNTTANIDYLIYAAKTPYLLGAIDPLPSTPTFNPTAIQSFNNPFVAHANQSLYSTFMGNLTFFMLPDQQDGEDYDEKFSGEIAAACCFNASPFDVYSYTAQQTFNNSFTQTWTPTNNPFGGTALNPLSVVKVRTDIIIPAGFNITMRDMTFEFLPRVTSCTGDPDDKPAVGSFGAGVKVQNGNGILAGGRLTLNNTTLTTYKECLDGMWEGVEVWGITGLAANSNQHGRLTMTNNAQIQNAYYGAKTDEIDHLRPI